MRRMGPAPGQQGARAREVSRGEKPGVAPGRRHARARAMGGTRWQAVRARACADFELETAKMEGILTASWIVTLFLGSGCNSAQKALNGRSAALQAAPRRHGRPGPGPGGAAAQPNVGTCENAPNFAMLLQKLQHTPLTAGCIRHPASTGRHRRSILPQMEASLSRVAAGHEPAGQP